MVALRALNYEVAVIHMNGIDFLIGSEKIVNTPLGVFDEIACALIADMSAEILQSSLSRLYPDLSALAFWGRKANLQKLKADFGNTEDRMGRGLCFHIAPSNIPVNFAFSYMFSLLAGNANIVRLPSKTYPQVDVFCSIFARIIEKYPTIAARTAFVRYPRSDEITAAFCRQADARMIWGGDNTIVRVKNLAALPRCVDITFADRYSVCILDGISILEANDAILNRLAENFYNDTWLMDQNACSSPQIILWKNDSILARETFWKSVLNVAKIKYTLQDAVSIEKYTLLCTEAISNPYIASFTQSGNLLYRVEMNALHTDISNHRGNGGFFFEYSLQDDGDLFSIITEKFQTITYFGLDPILLRNQLIARNVRGIDRIVPVGKAMDIGTIWDGHDIVRELSRIIKVV